MNKNKIWTYEEISRPHIRLFQLVGFIPFEETVNGTQLRTLPFRYFADIQEEPLFTIVYVFQGIVTYSIVVINTAAEATGYYVILLACGYLRSVRTRLRSLAERQDKLNSNDKENQNKTTELIYKDVLQCAKFHQNIMVYCEEIEQFMRIISFVGVFTTIYNISMIGIKMFQYMILMTLNVFQFFTYQWSPDGLLRESDAIANAAYSTSLKQVGNHKSINKILHFLIMRAQKPMQLTAGGFVKLSMETFGVMIKSAFSFFALLRNADI
ncbi:PREDICTED: odorant receptor Or2-like [Ceratosolen solmsi marchali]|uniref:Odorant receptor Or2-like n=1 Tax=Ceratosolen solmsi marchali TaxID=326594 RepID=A0AAJ7DZ81_9HYME|nr:PREDICTED: odorant receptor Or2-like [Ceratosolen solmsi marchali]